MEPKDTELPTISKEFLSKLLKKNVSSFRLKPGTNVGDNYMSVLYSIQVEVEEEDGQTKSVSLLSKCFPTHPTRQEFLRKSNVFWNELQIYKTFLPELQKMAQNNGIEIQLPFSPLVGGEALDFKNTQKPEEGFPLYGPFDIHITMPDLRSHGFRMADRQVGLDLEHVTLLMKAHAKYHSLSWAYKQKYELPTLSKKFPFLAFEMQEEDKAMFENVMVASAENALTAIGTGPPNADIYERTKIYQGKIAKIITAAFEDGNDPGDLKEFHRICPEETPNTRPWKVALHGDCWINNLLFRYNKSGNKPEEIVLIDLQMVREACPTMDMVYVLYSSTDSEFRKKHLDEMLELYHDEFLRNCSLLDVEPLPGFSVEELKRRFHVSKILGYCLAIMVLPIMLKDAADVMDLEKMKEGSGLDDMFNTLAENAGSNKAYSRRITEMARELYEEGVL